ncbi:MAG: hypothetical protein ACI9VT_002436, partial [Psychroserpens sp.]
MLLHQLQDKKAWSCYLFFKITQAVNLGFEL